jgi:uncharacterized RDD family membrane protein YckC
MDQILDSPESSGHDIEYAGFWIRFVALLIDVILLFIGQMAVTYLFFGSSNVLNTSPTTLVISFLIGVGYFTAMESSSRQGTLGKVIVGIKVGDVRGEQLTFGNALGRYFGKMLSAIMLMIGFMLAGWDPKKQTLHDKIANTYVFYLK